MTERAHASTRSSARLPVAALAARPPAEEAPPGWRRRSGEERTILAGAIRRYLAGKTRARLILRRPG
jgi:hypothetical protein